MARRGAAASLILLVVLGVSTAQTGPPSSPSSSTSTTRTSTTSTSTTSTSTAAPPKLVVAEPGSAGRFEYIQVNSSSSSSGAMEPAMQAGLEFLSGLYNPHHWSAPQGLPLSQACRQQVRTYLTALDNGTTWAVQMTDASGRYSSQFFFGNDFWLGSHTLCEELGSRYALANPPWPVTFHVVQIKVHLDLMLTPHARVLHLGVCLPRACDPKDITTLLHNGPSTKASKASKATSRDSASMEVVRIRRVPGPYALLSDTKLHILAGVSAAVIILMVAGAVLEEVTQRAARGAAKGAADSEHQAGPQGPQGQELQERPGKAAGKGRAKGMQPLAQKPGVMVQIVMAFSPLSNGAKILNCQQQEEDSLTAVHGLRFLSLAWVILVHTYLQVFAIAENKTLRTVTERNFLFQTVSNATFSVDTFFFISGLLVAFLYFKTTSKRTEVAAPSATTKAAAHGATQGAGQGASKADGLSFKQALSKFLVLVGYRFIRLTPAYLFVLGLVELSMRWIHNNSVFEPKILDHLNCDRYWWRNALYINSLFPRKDMCMLWSWYMSNDTQFYVIGVLLLLFSARHFRLVAGALVTLLVSSWVTTALVSVQYEYRARIEDPFDKFDELYDKPWTRLGPYLTGMVTGWALFKTRSRIRMSVVSSFSGGADGVGAVTALSGVAGVRPAAPEAGHRHLGRLRVAGPHRLGVGPQLDRPRLQHGPRGLHQHAALLPRPAAPQQAHLLRVSAAPDDPGAHLIPNGWAPPPPQRPGADAVLWERRGLLPTVFPHLPCLRSSCREVTQDCHSPKETFGLKLPICLVEIQRYFNFLKKHQPW